MDSPRTHSYLLVLLCITVSLGGLVAFNITNIRPNKGLPDHSFHNPSLHDIPWIVDPLMDWELADDKLVNVVLLEKAFVEDYQIRNRCSFLVDSSVTKILLVISCSDRRPKFVVQSPLGKRYTEGHAFSNSNDTALVSLDSPEPGNWNITVLHREDYEISVFGDSLLSMEAIFRDTWGGNSEGNPETGTRKILGIKVFGVKFHPKLQEIQLLSEEFREIQAYPTASIGARGRQHHLFEVWVKIPSQNFYIAVKGKNQKGQLFQRILKKLYKPVGIKLKIKEISSGMLMPGSSRNYSFYLENDINQPRNFSLNASVNNDGFQVQVSPSHVMLEAKDNTTGVVALLVSPSLLIGTVGQLQVKAVAADGTEQAEDNRHLVVTEDPRRQKDEDPPKFYTLKITDHCNNSIECKDDFWYVDFEVEDYQSGIHQINIENDAMATLLTEVFDDGQEITNGYIKVQCCRNNVTVIVTDVTGNNENIEILYPDYTGGDHGENTDTSATNSKNVSAIKIGIYVVGALTALLFAVIIISVSIQFYHEIRTCAWARKKWGKRREKSFQLQAISMKTKTKF